ncbi:MAG: DUF2334 domain-containing protein, partial [Thermoplasmata archaeon]
NNTFTNLTANDNVRYGIYLYSNSQNNIFTNSRIQNNTQFGIRLEHSGTNYPRYNLFYNNIFNNTINLNSTHSNNLNYWNTTLNCSAGPNIIGGNCIGGNYWTGPNGNYSDTCVDNDQDGICDNPYTPLTNNTDYLPLAYGSSCNYSNLKIYPQIPTENDKIQLNSTWICTIGNIDTVLLESNFTGSWNNYTTDHQDSEYYYTIREWYLNGGSTIGYRWYANDTNNNWFSTNLETFTVYYPWSDWKQYNISEYDTSFSDMKTVIFRMDDVGAFWHVNITKNLTNTHILKKVPLNIMIIPNRTDYGVITNDIELKNFLRNASIHKTLIELGQHGFRHISYGEDIGEFKGRSYEDQYNDINTGKEILNNAFYDVHGNITSFSPPYYLFDANTTYVCSQLNFTVFSSEIYQEIPPLPYIHNNFDEHGLLFTGVGVKFVKNETTSEFYSANEIIENCLDKLNKYGICVILYHPQDFATSFDILNETKYQILIQVIDALVEYKDISFSTMRDYYKWRSQSGIKTWITLDYYANETTGKSQNMEAARKNLLGKKSSILLKNATYINSTSNDGGTNYYDILEFNNIILEDQMKRILVIENYSPYWQCQNQVQNPGFENGSVFPDNWSFTNSQGDAVGGWDSQVRYLGVKSVNISHNSVDDKGYWSQYISVSELTSYKISGRIKSNDNGEGSSGIWLEYYSSDWSYLGGESVEWNSGNFDWKKVEKVITTPSDTVYMFIFLVYDNGIGTTWFDEIEVSNYTCNAEIKIIINGINVTLGNTSKPENYTINLSPYTEENSAKKVNISVYVGRPNTNNYDVGYNFSKIEIVNYFYGSETTQGDGGTENYNVINFSNIYLPEDSNITLKIINYDDWFNSGYWAEINISVNNILKEWRSQSQIQNYSFDLSAYNGTRVNISVYVGRPYSNDVDVGYRFDEIFLEYYKQRDGWECERWNSSIFLEPYENKSITNAVICNKVGVISQGERWEINENNIFIKNVTINNTDFLISYKNITGYIILPKEYNFTHKIVSDEFLMVKNSSQQYQNITPISQCPIYDSFLVDGNIWKVCWNKTFNASIKDIFKFIIPNFSSQELSTGGRLGEEECSVDFNMSVNLQQGISFGEADPGSINVSALGNGYYYITDLSTSSCGKVKIYIKSSGDLINGTNIIKIGNVTVNSTSPDSQTIQLSTDYQVIRSNIPAGENNITTLYFWLNVPFGQEPKIYTTSVFIRMEKE